LNARVRSPTGDWRHGNLLFGRIGRGLCRGRNRMGRLLLVMGLRVSRHQLRLRVHWHPWIVRRTTCMSCRVVGMVRRKRPRHVVEVWVAVPSRMPITRLIRQRCTIIRVCHFCNGLGSSIDRSSQNGIVEMGMMNRWCWIRQRRSSSLRRNWGRMAALRG